MAKPPAGYSIQQGRFFSPKGAGGAVRDPLRSTATISDNVPPSGYSFQDGAYFTDDGQGPYSWDGATMTLLGSGPVEKGSAAYGTQKGGYFTPEGLGPYVWDGAAMRLL